ncbi:hypothetical protein STEG23_031396, partial [Scotinomys teguina]
SIKSQQKLCWNNPKDTMAKLILAAGLAIVLNAQLASAYKLMCYYTREAKSRSRSGKFKPDDINPCLCTHIIYAYATIRDNEITWINPEDWKDYETINNLKNSNMELKTLLAIGGKKFPSIGFSVMVSTPQKRQTFIKSVIKFLRENKADGLTLDWQFPGSGESQSKDKYYFTLLVKEIHEAFENEPLGEHKTRLLITSTGAGITSIIKSGYNIHELSQYLDYIQVLTYDLHSYKDHYTGENSPLYRGPNDIGLSAELNVDYIMTYWKNNGADPKKLIVGFPTYGQTFTLSDSSEFGIHVHTIGVGQPGKYTNETGLWAYYEICSFLDSGATEKWNVPQDVPYAFRDTEWVGYDNIKSFQIKAQWLKDNNLGGATVWPLDMDDFTGSFCKQGKFPLTNTLKEALNVQSPSCKASYREEL